MIRIAHEDLVDELKFICKISLGNYLYEHC